MRWKNKYGTFYCSTLKPSGDYMPELSEQRVTLYFVYVGFVSFSL
jgi:hypothetical protein